MTYLKTLIALTGLALLTACAGGVTINNNDNSTTLVTVATCTANPFTMGCNATQTQAEAFCRDNSKTTNTKTADCAPTVMRVCTDNPYEADLCLNNNDYAAARATIRVTCSSTDDAVRDALCPVIVTEDCTDDPFLPECLVGTDGAGKYKTDRDEEILSICPDNPFQAVICFIGNTYEQGRATQTLNCRNGVADAPNCDLAKAAVCDDNIFDDFCMGLPDLATMRETACQTHGTGMGGNDSCATSLIAACGIANPFAHAGCDDVVDIDSGVRTMFCEMPANAWNPKCMDTTHGTVTATRVTACQMFGTDTGGDDSCATSLATVCDDIANPFIYPGCDDVAGIDAGVRATYCTTTVNAFTTGCMDGTHGQVLNAQGRACLTSPAGTPANPLCAENTLAEQSCESNPFDDTKPGCRNLTKFPMFADTYCGLNPRESDCEAKYSAWLDSFVENPPTTTPATTNPSRHGFLRGEAATVDFGSLRLSDNSEPLVRRLNLQDASHNNVPLGGDEEDGIAYFEARTSNNVDGGYAGIFSGTNLGAPLPAYVAESEPSEPTAIWYGKFGVVGEVTITNQDFELNVNFQTRKINAFVQFQTTTQHFKLNGDFNGRGVIVNGEVVYGNFTDNNKEMVIDDTVKKSGILTGLIGQEGAVGVFHADDNAAGTTTYVGGFVAAPAEPCVATDTCPVNTAAWLRSFTGDDAPPAMPNLSPPANEFLRGTKTTLLTTGTQFSGSNTAAPEVITITLADNDLGGVAADGFSYFKGYIPAASRSYHYAGILSGTDLGAPLTQQPISTLWRGHIRLRGFTTLNKSFTLTVNYGVGSQVGGGTLSAFVRLGSAGTTLFYKIDAEFNAKGLIITGDATNPNIVYDEFTGANPDMPDGSGDRHTGILSGLIGEQGVVAAFISNPHAVDSYVFSGGFVAEPVAPEDDFPNKVTFNDWVRLSDYRLFGSAASADADSTAPSHFIRPKTDGTFDLTDVTLVTPYTVSRTGDDKDGFVYAAGTIGGRTNSFVGILPSTDLGAPLTEAIVTVRWPGQFSFGSTETLTPIDFTITFDGTDSGTINGMGETTIEFDLDFDGKGIITGNVISTALGFGGTAPARGLIGEEGLVGVFANINGSESAHNLFGGFVAAPPVVNQAAWVASFSGGVPARITATLVAANRKRQFLAGGEDALIDINDTIGVPVYFGLTFASAMYDGEALIGDNDIKDGFAGLVDTVSGNNKVYYVGLLSGTDLGAPLTETFGSITWNGQIETVLAGVADIKKDFSLKITLGEGKGVAGALGSIAGAVLSDGTNHYQLTGTYDANGVIDGEVIYGEFTGSIAEGNLETTAPANGILTGLIGEHGAVGVFLAGGGTKENIPDRATPTGGYAGGFVVSGPQPPRQPVVQPDDTDTDNVAFNDWLRGFGEFPPLTKLTVPPRDRRREFLAGGTEGLATTGAMNVDDTRNISANLASLGRGGDAADGYNYFFDTVATNTYIPYAGLLADTDLGARLTETEGTATWNGKLRATLNGTVHTNSDLALRITYGGTNGETGSIAGEVKTNTNNLYELRGNYTDSGVISGTVYYGRVNSGSLVRTFPSAPPNGFLTGLIGAQGAVGVFIAGTGTKEAIDSPAGNYYAGGFIVSPE